MCANFQIEITDPRMMEIMKAALRSPNALSDDFSLLIKNKGEVFPLLHDSRPDSAGDLSPHDMGVSPVERQRRHF